MIGNGPSAYDISREIATVAKEVHLSSRSPDVKVSRLGNHHNIWQHSKAGLPYMKITYKQIFHTKNASRMLSSGILEIMSHISSRCLSLK